MKNFLNEHRRITENDLPKEMHMGWYAYKCPCGHPIGLKANPIGLDKGLFTKYCTGCKKNFEQIELEGEDLLQFLIEFLNHPRVGGVA